MDLVLPSYNSLSSDVAMPNKMSATRCLISILPFLGGLVASGFAIAGYFPNLWICDIASQLRLVWEIVLALCVILLAVLRLPLLTIVIACGLIANSIPIADLYLSLKDVESPRSTTISILNVNTEYQHNDRYDLLEQLIQKRNPDVLAIIEANKKWIDAIKPTTNRYKYQKVVIVGPGMALFSKFPIEHCDVRYFGKSHHPRILATLLVDQSRVQVVLAHPTTPKSPSGYAERSKELLLLRDELNSFSSPKVLIGDLNCGPWAADFHDLLGAGLHDSEKGFGPQPSWPARNGRVYEYFPIPPMVPIDHVLVSDEFQILKRQTDMSIGSDHLPVFVEASLRK